MAVLINILERLLRNLAWLVVTMSSTSVIVPIYFIKIRYTFFHFPDCINIGDSLLFIIHLVLYIAIPVVLTLLGIWIMKKLGTNDELKRIKGSKENLFRIIPAETSNLPTYLGYFFIALSIPGESVNGTPEQPSWTIFFAVYFILNGLLALSEKSFFNPLVMVRYNFYNVLVNNQVEILVISRKDIKKDGGDEVEFPHLLKVTETIFIDKDK